MRTEEKKREKDHPPALPADQANSNPAPLTATSLDQVDDAPETRGLSVAVGDADHPNHSAGVIEVTDKLDDSKLQTSNADDTTNNSSNNQVDEKVSQGRSFSTSSITFSLISELKYGNSIIGADNNAFNENTNVVPPGTSVLAQPNGDPNNPLDDFTSGQSHGVPAHSHGSDAYGNGPGYGVDGMGGYPQTGWQGGSNYGQMMQTLPGGVQLNGMMPFQNAMGTFHSSSVLIFDH